jgi:hypothetical protein
VSHGAARGTRLADAGAHPVPPARRGRTRRATAYRGRGVPDERADRPAEEADHR